ncbi:hypothetical protein CEXT_445571 [Caerostris extrusa]|uniref:Uncharacterized protein n=1 Tax=Caerostris extrusa TaxID=172846 RepID=A0AAV4PPB7_CAEEX|nr:hypothetical protein CEXT_445571 [Caerostris extrusa]
MFRFGQRRKKKVTPLHAAAEMTVFEAAGYKRPSHNQLVKRSLHSIGHAWRIPDVRSAISVRPSTEPCGVCTPHLSLAMKPLCEVGSGYRNMMICD